MYLTFIIFFFFFLLVIDTYFYRAIKYVSKKLSPKKRKLIKQIYWSITIFVLLFLITSILYFISKTPPPKFARVYILGFVFIITVSKIIGTLVLLLFDLFRFILFVINKTLYRKVEHNKNKNAISRAEFLKKAGLITAAIPFGTMFYGVIKSAFDYTIHRQDLTINNLPNSFKGLKIIQLSDIHAGSFISDEPFKTAVELVNKENPDIIIFTGDLVNEISEEALPFIEVLKSLKAKFGVFSILGNHDYGDYFDELYRNSGRLAGSAESQAQSDAFLAYLYRDLFCIDESGCAIISGINCWYGLQMGKLLSSTRSVCFPG